MAEELKRLDSESLNSLITNFLPSSLSNFKNDQEKQNKHFIYSLLHSIKNSTSNEIHLSVPASYDSSYNQPNFFVFHFGTNYPPIIINNSCNDITLQKEDQPTVTIPGINRSSNIMCPCNGLF